jgi:hypothetical protein
MIQGIQSAFVEQAWTYVEEYIVNSLKHGIGEYTPEDIKQACIENRMQLWVKWDDEASDTTGAFVTQILNYPQLNVLLVLLLGGKEFLEWREEVDELLHRFGKEHDCKYVEFFGRKGWGNYLKDINYKEQVRMFSKEIV